MEMAFSKPEAHLRRIGARNCADMFDALTEIRDLYSPQECRNDFKATGYVSSQKPDALIPWLPSAIVFRSGCKRSQKGILWLQLLNSCAS